MLMARSEVKGYCCGLTEECTPAYVATVKEMHQDRWIYGLCAEAIKDENSRSSRKIDQTFNRVKRNLRMFHPRKSFSTTRSSSLQMFETGFIFNVLAVKQMYS
ncbi:hypothetical protein FF1_019314 [Malus domestica]